jgi:hypothetical protein
MRGPTIPVASAMAGRASITNQVSRRQAVPGPLAVPGRAIPGGGLSRHGMPGTGSAGGLAGIGELPFGQVSQAGTHTKHSRYAR